MCFHVLSDRKTHSTLEAMFWKKSHGLNQALNIWDSACKLSPCSLFKSPGMFEYISFFPCHKYWKYSNFLEQQARSIVADIVPSVSWAITVRSISREVFARYGYCYTLVPSSIEHWTSSLRVWRRHPTTNVTGCSSNVSLDKPKI